MGNETQTITYRPPSSARTTAYAIAGAPPAGCLVAAAAFQQSGALVVGLLLAVVTIPIATWYVQPTGVTLTTDSLVIRVPWRQTTIAWTDLCAVEPTDAGGPTGFDLWVMSRAGWFLLPRPTTARSDDDPRTLDVALRDTWLERRGADWQPASLAPWVPTRDERGRVVLRAPLGQVVRVATLLGWLFAAQLAISSIRPLERLPEVLPRMAVWAVAVIVAIAYAAWARTTIEDDGFIVVRSFRGISRVARQTVVAVRVQSLRSNRRQLVVDTASTPGDALHPVSGTIDLGVGDGASWQLADPELDRKLRWMQDHLTDEHAVADASARSEEAPPVG